MPVSYYAKPEEGVEAEAPKRSLVHYNYASDERHDCHVFAPISANMIKDEEGIVNPAQDSVICLRHWWRHFSNPGDWTLDLMCGVGTGAVAAVLEGRNVIAIDNNKRQVKVCLPLCTCVGPIPYFIVFLLL